MPAEKRAIRRVWVDPDDAPEWTKEQFDRAEIAVGGQVVSPAQGNAHASARPAEEGGREGPYAHPPLAAGAWAFPSHRTSRRASTRCCASGSRGVARGPGRARSAPMPLESQLMTALTPFVATIVRITSRGRDLSPASQQAWRAARHSARDLMKSCLRR